ncbi:MAG: hypothetical protein JWN14_3874 [Chthonomonadales bacterium]|nr:hypothetical protein [Chthonomonadales bacterium]
MPHIRIMNWNIEKLSWKKIQINGMANAIARVVVGSNIDILVIVEVQLIDLDLIMQTLTDEINLLQPLPRSYWLTSKTTGGEHYGFIIRNIATIRPLQFATNGNAPLEDQSNGTANLPFTNLHALNWTTWPVAFPALVPPPHMAPPRPEVGLTNTFVSPPHQRPSKIRKTGFAGQDISNGGFSQGRGYRMPCLAIFVVEGLAGALTYLPIVVCHYASVRGGRNFLAQQQVKQLNQLHIAQLFSFDYGNAGVGMECGYLAIDAAAVPVTNLIFTGDFNIDFLENDMHGDNVAQTNREALDALTPTEAGEGSEDPDAAAGAALPVPVVPFNAWPAAPEAADINIQALRAACTSDGTILKSMPDLIPPPALHPATFPLPPPANIYGGAIDNFFYGGAEANTAVVNFGLGNHDSGEIIDVPALIEQMGAGGAPPNIAINALQAHYANKVVKCAAQAPNLSGAAGVAAALTASDRWIGARLVSDHVPSVLEIICP